MSVIADLAVGRKEGRKVDIREGYMKQSAGAHIVFYHVADDHFDIVRILHGRMDVGRHL
ncbi:type II toxin-antitoxin system RelE/ParE family toxin [Hwanghaeella grinnelliae]|uniref:type II toxin-antitoxin system RelE/ParE family toxin n=1 Tax=Hwanghaeella grinnelliae TaxID=2500179 RepID=UPI003B8341F1